MTIAQLAAVKPPDAAPAATGLEPQALDDTFMLLLVAQLKNQNPLDPRDGAEFLQDLVNLNSLNELVAIHALLDGSQTVLAGSSQTTGDTQK